MFNSLNLDLHNRVFLLRRFDLIAESRVLTRVSCRLALKLQIGRDIDQIASKLSAFFVFGTLLSNSLPFGIGNSDCLHEFLHCSYSLIVFRFLDLGIQKA